MAMYVKATAQSPFFSHTHHIQVAVMRYCYVASNSSNLQADSADIEWEKAQATGKTQRRRRRKTRCREAGNPQKKGRGSASERPMKIRENTALYRVSLAVLERRAAGGGSDVNAGERGDESDWRRCR
eukprot:scaffold18734_cov38-Cyclotella_meneghiniana.AAC.1